jgi:hypothetical protein
MKSCDSKLLQYEMIIVFYDISNYSETEILITFHTILAEKTNQWEIFYVLKRVKYHVKEQSNSCISSHIIKKKH